MAKDMDLRTMAKKVSDKLLNRALQIQRREEHVSSRISSVNKRIVNSLDEANEEAAKAYANEVGNMKRFHGQLHRVGVVSEGAGHRFSTVIGLGDSVHAVSILGEHSYDLSKGVRKLGYEMGSLSLADTVNDLMSYNIPDVRIVSRVDSVDAEKILREAEKEVKRRVLS
ncbi:MAG: hypothetical protein QW128_07465 [Thermoprotei archaeon]